MAADSDMLKIFVRVIFITGFVASSTAVRKIRYPINRSYQVPLSVINGGQGLQYYSTAPLYTAIPTVLIPNQIGLSSNPVASVVLPQADYKPVQEVVQESPIHGQPGTYKSAKFPVTLYKAKYRGSGQAYKRPGSLLNYVYSTPVKGYPTMQTQKLPSISLQPSSDLEVQYQQHGSPSTVYQSTMAPPTYSTGKVVEYVKKPRVPAGHQTTYYRRVTGSGHRHPMYTSKKVYLTHKGHHHHYPSKYFAHPKYHPVKYVSPTTSLSTESPIFVTSRPTVPETTGTYGYSHGGEVRFPEDQETPRESADNQHTRNTAPGDITRAIMRSPNVISNYDASLPLKVPSKKPYRFEVSDLIKNYVAGGSQGANHQGVDYSQVRGNSYGVGTQFATLPLTSAGSSTLDIYNMAGSSAYQSNHLVSDQDLDSSRTVRIPVAVIKGAHDLSGTGLVGFPKIHQGDGDLRKDFSPSKRTSDWIPMSSGISLDAGNQEGSNSSPPQQKAVRPQVEEIISGKIPQEFAPNLGRNDEGDIVTGKIPFSPGQTHGIDGNKRKNSFVLPPSSVSDTSDLVVSSMIKFS